MSKCINCGADLTVIHMTACCGQPVPDTPTPEAVENGMGLRTGNTALDVLTAERDALLARVDALTKELAFSEGERSEAEDRANAFATKEMRTEARAIRAEAQRDAALAASGAVEETMHDKIEALRTDPSSSIMQDAYWAKTWDACIDRVLELIPTDAAAALAEDRKRVREEERKACAEVARSRYLAWHQGCPVECDATACEDIAAAILARKEG